MRPCQKYRFVGKRGIYQVHDASNGAWITRDGMVMTFGLHACDIASMIDAIVADTARNGPPSDDTVVVLDIRRPPPDTAGPPRPTVGGMTFDQQYNGAPLTGSPCGDAPREVVMPPPQKPAEDQPIASSDLRPGDQVFFAGGWCWVTESSDKGITIDPMGGATPIEVMNPRTAWPRAGVRFRSATVAEMTHYSTLKPGDKVRIHYGWETIVSVTSQGFQICENGAIIRPSFSGWILTRDIFRS